MSAKAIPKAKKKKETGFLNIILKVHDFFKEKDKTKSSHPDGE